MKKNLILFYPSFEKGGVEKILKNLISNNNKFEITLISSKKAKENLNLEKINFVEVKQYFKLPLIHSRYLSAINAMIVLHNYLKTNKKKYLIHSMQSNVAAIIVSILKGNKIIIRNSENPVYSFLYADNKFFSFLSLILKYLFYNFADGIVTNSIGSKKSLESFIFKKNKIQTIYNPYLNKIYRKKNNKKKCLINIGRLTKQKDHETLIKAFHIFSKTNKEYKLLILGGGNLEIKLKQLAKDLNLHKRVIFKGWIKNTTSYLKFSKLFILSSVYEGLGNVLIDAVNFNTPSISTNCYSGPSEILLNGRGGYLVKIKSPELLAKKIQFCVSNYSIALKKNLIAKKSLKRFLIKSQSKKYFDYLAKHI